MSSTVTPPSKFAIRPASFTSAVLALAIVVATPSRADVSDLAFPRLQDPSSEDHQDYSYYYVPQLSELNQHVGTILRTGRVRLDSPSPAATISHYSAYSCSGTFHLTADTGQTATRDVDWADVTGLRSVRTGPQPSLVIETLRTGGPDHAPLVLYFSDRELRFQLHHAFAVLMTACHAAAFPHTGEHAPPEEPATAPAAVAEPAAPPPAR